MELAEAQKQYEADSLAFVNADLAKAKEKLARLEELKSEYLTGEKPDTTIKTISYEDYYQNEMKLQAMKDTFLNGYSTNFEELEMLTNAYAADLINEVRKSNQYAAEVFAIAKGDKNLVEMDKKIYDARKEVDIATENVFKKTKERLANAKKVVKIQEIAEKERNNEAISVKEFAFASNELLNDMIKNQEINNALHDELVKELNELSRKDSIMEEFNKAAK